MKEAEKALDWLEGDSQVAKEEQRLKALDFARLYEVFVQDPRAKRILEFWDVTLRRKKVAVNATIQEYAAHAALRDFIEGILQQIEFSKTEGKTT